MTTATLTRHPALDAVDAAATAGVFDGWDPLTNPSDPLVKIDKATRTVRALVAPFDACILNGREGPNVCRRPPRDGQGYDYAHTGGDVGVIGRSLSHADPQLSQSAAAEHYANTARATYIGRYYEDDDAIWFEGMLAPNVTDDDIFVLSAGALSGDWRWVQELRRLKLIASQCVSVPGFRKAYDVMGNRNFALVASASTPDHDLTLITTWTPISVRDALVEAIIAVVRHAPAGSKIGGQFISDNELGGGPSSEGEGEAKASSAGTITTYSKMPPSKRTSEPDEWFASEHEFAQSKRLANKKARNVPKPTAEHIARNRAQLDKAKQGGRAGGELRGNSFTRRARGEALFNEFGGAKRGYVPCAHCGLKISPGGRDGFGVMTQDKILVATEGGDYGTAKSFPNIIPSCTGCNASRNNARYRIRPSWEHKKTKLVAAIRAAAQEVPTANGVLVSHGVEAIGYPLGWDDPDLQDEVLKTRVQGILGTRKVTTDWGEYTQTIIGNEIVDPKTVKSAKREALLAAVRHAPAGTKDASGKRIGGQFVGDGKDDTVKTDIASHGTRDELVKRLRKMGYTGPVSYGMPKLRKIAEGYTPGAPAPGGVTWRGTGQPVVPPSHPTHVPPPRPPTYTPPTRVPIPPYTPPPPPPPSPVGIPHRTAPPPDHIIPHTEFTRSVRGRGMAYEADVGHGRRVRIIDTANVTTSQQRDEMAHGIRIGTAHAPIDNDTVLITIGTGRGQTLGYVNANIGDRPNAMVVTRTGLTHSRAQGGTNPSAWNSAAADSMPSATYTTLHEYGHLVDYNSRIASPNGAQRQGRATRGASSIGRYAAKNAAEEKAEAFAEWAGTGGRTTNTHVQALAQHYGWTRGTTRHSPPLTSAKIPAHLLKEQPAVQPRRRK